MAASELYFLQMLWSMTPERLSVIISQKKQHSTFNVAANGIFYSGRVYLAQYFYCGPQMDSWKEKDYPWVDLPEIVRPAATSKAVKARMFEAEQNPAKDIKANPT